MVRSPAVLQEGTSAFGEGHEGRAAVALKRGHAPNEARAPQPFQVAVSEIPRPALVIAKIARRHNPKRPDCRQRARFGAAQSVRLFVHVHAFARRPTRQIEAGCQGVARIEILGLAAVVGVRLSRVEQAGIGAVRHHITAGKRD